MREKQARRRQHRGEATQPGLPGMWGLEPGLVPATLDFWAENSLPAACPCTASGRPAPRGHSSTSPEESCPREGAGVPAGLPFSTQQGARAPGAQPLSTALRIPRPHFRVCSNCTSSKGHPHATTPKSHDHHPLPRKPPYLITICHEIINTCL